MCVNIVGPRHGSIGAASTAATQDANSLRVGGEGLPHAQTSPPVATCATSGGGAHAEVPWHQGAGSGQGVDREVQWGSC